MYRKVRAWLCTLLVCIAVKKKKIKYLYSAAIASPIKLYFMCRWLVTYLASSAFNSVICVGRNVESLETSSCIGSNPEPIGWRELKHHLALGKLGIKPTRFKMAFLLLGSFCESVEGVSPPPELHLGVQGPRASVTRCPLVASISPFPWCQSLPGTNSLLREMLPCRTQPRTDKLRK